MEGKRQLARRSLHRVHIVTRMEEQLWVEAYEQLWPRGRRRSRPPARPGYRDSAVDSAATVLPLGA
jgi:hypothetical protein